MSQKYPLWMPKGSVRALITFGLIALLGMAIFFELAENSVAIVAALTGSAVTFYFNKRGDDDRAERDE